MDTWEVEGIPTNLTRIPRKEVKRKMFIFKTFFFVMFRIEQTVFDEFFKEDFFSSLRSMFGQSGPQTSERPSRRYEGRKYEGQTLLEILP